MTLTLDLPDETAARAYAVAETRGLDLNGFFAVILEEAFAVEDDEPDWEIVAAGLEAVEDIRAGRLVTLEEADAHFEEALAEARVRVRAQISEAGASPPGALARHFA